MKKCYILPNLYLTELTCESMILNSSKGLDNDPDSPHDPIIGAPGRSLIKKVN